MRENLTIWCNPLLSEVARELLRDGAKPHRLMFAPHPAYNLVSGPPDATLADVDVAFGQPDARSAMQSRRLGWIHLTSAGYVRYDNAGFRSWAAERGVILTNSSRVYAEPCAQHALAFMLADARQLPTALKAQLTDHSWNTMPLRATSRLLVRQNVLLLGYGAIARRLAELLAPFEMKITALRRTAGEDRGIRIITAGQLCAALAEADHVVNTLPEGASTEKFVSEEHFAAMKRGAVFYNVGRGRTVDQDALLAALQANRLRAAYLDVTVPEPLPPDHPLWTTRGAYITPHSAGGHDDEHQRFVRHFLENLRRYTSGEPLLDRVM
jgi:phosphoglycerate dehydrogenase-like enzyme